MELTGDQELGKLLHTSAVGELATFAAFLDMEDEDIEVLNAGSDLADARGRKIFKVFEILNPPEDDDIELGTDLCFYTEAEYLELAPGAIVEREIDHAIFGKITVQLVKLSSEDADFLLGVLPGEVLTQVAPYEEDGE